LQLAIEDEIVKEVEEGAEKKESQGSLKLKEM
jgi:hypothetical protein